METSGKVERQPCGQACVSVVIPAFNEARTIAAVIRAGSVQPIVRELIVVDDGSFDGTWEVIRRLAEADSRIKAIRHSANLGKGAALRTGFRQATSPIVLVQDADLEYDPADYPALVAPIVNGHADIVVGSRFMGGHKLRGRRRWHAAGNQLLTRFFNVCANQRLTDMASGFKVFRLETLQHLNLQENGFGFDAEIVAKVLRWGGARLCEVPISYCPRSYADGKKIGWRDGVTFLWCIVKYGLRPDAAAMTR